MNTVDSDHFYSLFNRSGMNVLLCLTSERHIRISKFTFNLHIICVKSRVLSMEVDKFQIYTSSTILLQTMNDLAAVILSSFRFALII